MTCDKNLHSRIAPEIAPEIAPVRCEVYEPWSNLDIWS